MADVLVVVQVELVVGHGLVVVGEVFRGAEGLVFLVIVVGAVGLLVLL